MREAPERPLFTLDNVNVWVECEPEDMPVVGNYLCTDEPKLDRKEERKIQRRLDRGEEWAWCVVKVSVSPKNPWYSHMVAVDYLGGCSFEDKRDFILNSGYYEDMVGQCICELNNMEDTEG